MLRIDSQHTQSDRAPIVLQTDRRPWPMFEGKQLAPYDTAWLAQILRQHLVSGLCAGELKSCPDTVPTTYLSLQDPRWNLARELVVDVVETALDPAACRTRRTILDFQEISFTIGKTGGDWVVDRFERGGHGFAFCPS